MSRSHLARLGSAVVAGLLAVGVLGAPAAAAGTGTVQGTFTTSNDTPIAGATVAAYSADQSWLADTTTDQDGHYTLSGVASGGVKVQFDDHGRQQWSPGVLAFTEATLYDLADGGTVTVDEHQLATGKLAGHFTDSSGAGFPTFVAAQSVGDPWAFLTTTADADGAWSIDVLPGAYKVNFQWDSVRQWAVQQSGEDAATTFTVAAGATVTVDDHKLPTGTAGGRLTTAAGGPLASANVSLHLDGRSVGGATTDDDGHYSFGEILAGDGYTVSFSVNGGADQWVSGTLDPAQARRFTIVAGEDTTIDDTQLATAEMHGRLVDADGGGPQAGYHVSVTLDDDNNWVEYDTDTDQDGRWSVSGVFPGNYRVSFVSPDWKRTQYAYGKGSSADAALIAVAAGASVTVDDTWLPGANLVVNAVDATTGAPVSDFCVWVDSPGDGSGCTTGSQLTVGNLPGGAFHVSLTPGETSYYLNKNVPVSLTAGETTTVTIPLTLGGKVAVTATGRDTGAAVRGACAVFKVLGQGGLPDGYGDCTDQTGKTTTVAMAAGTYELFAVAPSGYGHQWVGPHGGTGDQRAAARVKIKPGTTVKAPTVLLDRPGMITGVVSDPAGKPIADGDVAYSAWGDAGPAWDTSTDEKGHYTLDQLGPYAWPLLFGGGGYARQWSGHQGNRFKAETVPVVAGGSTTYDFIMTTGSTLKGTVTAPSTSWRLNIVNAAAGDQMGVFDSTGAGANASYSLPLIGGQQVKVKWSYYVDNVTTQGWYDHAADIAGATKVGIPANGTRRLNLVLD